MWSKLNQWYCSKTMLLRVLFSINIIYYIIFYIFIPDNQRLPGMISIALYNFGISFPVLTFLNLVLLSLILLRKSPPLTNYNSINNIEKFLFIPIGVAFLCLSIFLFLLIFSDFFH